MDYIIFQKLSVQCENWGFLLPIAPDNRGLSITSEKEKKHQSGKDYRDNKAFQNMLFLIMSDLMSKNSNNLFIRHLLYQCIIEDDPFL